MNCNKQTMWKAGFGLLVAGGVAYAALPEFRAWILAVSPVLLLLLCPLSMLFCMKMMNDKACQTSSSDKAGKAAPSSPDADVSRN